MALIVQEMADSARSGAIFTNCRVNGSRRGEYMLIEACYGQLAPMMNNQLSPDIYVLERKGQNGMRVADRKPGDQKTMSVIDNGRLVERPSPEKFVLQEKDLFELWRIGLDIEKRFNGYPQDIEFTYASVAAKAGKAIYSPSSSVLYILQNRDQLDPIPWRL